MEPEEQRPLRRSEALAVQNAKRIAAQLREERNDAVVLAQLRREQAEAAIALCRRLLDGADPTAAAADLDAIVKSVSSDG